MYEMDELIIGIDLGTSTSEVAYLKDGKPFIIPNHRGDKITPSVIGVDDFGDWMIGEEAKDQLLAKPNDTIMEVKRHMGEHEKIKVGEHLLSPEELSAKILSYLKECASSYLGQEVKRAVITVPAYFTNEQRKATVEAGELAGLKVERIVNEPTAAALAYGIDHMEDEAHILVYDLGGGTLDVTLLESMAGVFEVKASSGDNALGGKDFDQKIIDYFIKEFLEKEQIDLSQDPLALSRLKVEAEKCKKALSKASTYEVNLPFIAVKEGNPIGLKMTFTRECFEGLIKELIESTAKAINCVLSDGKVSKEMIDVVLLVGGSTRIPLVKQFLQDTLGKEPQSLVDPDLAVVMGASIQGGIIDGVFDEEEGIMITDVCPYTLGINVLDFKMGIPNEDGYSVIIPRNVTIPVTKSEVYMTAVDGQTDVDIKVYQGDSPRASKNFFLDAFRLSGIPPKPAGEEKIKVAFSYDKNGLLKVEAHIVSTGEKATIEITTTGVSQSVDIIEDEEKNLDLETWSTYELAGAFKRTIKKAEKCLDEGEPDIAETKQALRRNLNHLKKAIIMNNESLAEGFEENILDIIYELEE